MSTWSGFTDAYRWLYSTFIYILYYLISYINKYKDYMITALTY